MQIDKTYIRLSPNGDRTEVTPKSQSEIDYYRSFEADGFEYVAKPIIHNNEACESCSA